MKKREEFVRSLLSQMSGTICDLATGRGSMLQKILDCTDGKESVDIVCTD